MEKETPNSNGSQESNFEPQITLIDTDLLTAEEARLRQDFGEAGRGHRGFADFVFIVKFAYKSKLLTRTILKHESRQVGIPF